MSRRYPLTIRRGPWKFIWHGGRLADVYFAPGPGRANGKVVDCTQVGGYDWQAGAPTSEYRIEVLAEAADEWMRECSDDFARELPYLV